MPKIQQFVYGFIVLVLFCKGRSETLSCVQWEMDPNVASIPAEFGWRWRQLPFPSQLLFFQQQMEAGAAVFSIPDTYQRMGLPSILISDMRSARQQ